MKRNTYTSILLLFILMLLFGSSYATNWGGTLPPHPSKNKSSSDTQAGSGNSGDDSLFVANEELFPECVQNSDEIKVGIYLNYPSNSWGFDKIDVELKIYDNNLLIHSEIKNGLGESYLYFRNITGIETSLRFVFDVHTEIDGEQFITSVEYTVQFSQDCELPILLQNDLAYPNPTRDNSTLKYNLGNDAYVTIWLFDIHGATLIKDADPQNGGEYEIDLQMSNKGNGTYRYKIIVYDGKRTNEKSATIIKNQNFHNITLPGNQ